MKSGYLSDVHLDFHCSEVNPQHPKFKRQIIRFIKDKLKPEKGRILFIAGDIGHYNHQNQEFLTQMSEWYDFIILVPGNHDLYLDSNSQKSKYNLNSFDRLNEMKRWCFDQESIFLLDGASIKIDGIKIAGFSNWYNLDTGMKIDRWKRVMNDSNYIMEGSEPHVINFGYGGSEKVVSFDTQRYYEEQLEHIKRFSGEGCDILVCHVCPIIIPNEYLNEEYHHDPDNIFYMVDHEELVSKTKAKIVLYGHLHDEREFVHNGINYKINAIGYPGEKCGTKEINHFNIEGKE